MRLTRFLFSAVFILSFVGGVLGLSVSLALVDQFGKDLPEYKNLVNYVPHMGTDVLAADGSLISRRSDERRTFVPYGKIPKLVIQAFVSAEDRYYFTHHGVDPVAIVRAALGNASGARMSGASTITQQVAKNLLVGNERSYARKIREALLAYRMDAFLGKEKVLEIYLNEIFLGMGAYGIEEAAQTYFGKSLDELSVEEAATIAALPKAPSSLNPVRNPQRAFDRRNYVLGRMKEDGYISPNQYDDLVRRPIALVPRRGQNEVASEGQNGWFKDDALRYLTAKTGADFSEKHDLIIKTTLRSDLQFDADTALRHGVIRLDQMSGWRGPIGHISGPVNWSDERLVPPLGAEAFSVGVVEDASSTSAVIQLVNETKSRVTLGADGIRWTKRGRVNDVVKQGDIVLVDLAGGRISLAQIPQVEGGIVVMNPKTGDVMALLGGVSHDRSSFDRITQARRQPGSSFKPVVYATGLELGYEPMSPLLDAPIVLEQGPGQEDWRPNDAKGAGKGRLLTFRRSIENSRNLTTVRLLWDMGLSEIETLGRKFGLLGQGQISYSTALGSQAVSPINLVSAYAAFANGGHLVEPRYVTSYVDRVSKQEHQIAPQVGERVVSDLTDARLTSMLRGVVLRGTARSAFEGFDRYFVGKTGTTNSAKDLWFVGYAEDIVVGVWLGRDDDTPLPDGVSGGKYAAGIAREFLDLAGNSIVLKERALPEGLKLAPFDLDTGLPTTSKSNVVQEVVQIEEK